MNYKYLLDSNVVATSKVISAIDSNFFKENCVVMSEIVHELSDTSFSKALESLASPLSVKCLDRLPEVVDDMIRLGLLKTDHGNGEAILLAEALSMLDADGQAALSFMQLQPVIVTNEKLVEAYAKSKNIKSINGREFEDIIKSTEA